MARGTVARPHSYHIHTGHSAHTHTQLTPTWRGPYAYLLLQGVFPEEGVGGAVESPGPGTGKPLLLTCIVIN